MHPLIKRLKKKNYINISIDIKKVFGKMHCPFMIKTISKLGIEGIFLNQIKNNYVKLREKKEGRV